ncbi:MAG: hypothetical protein Q8K58_05665 [Acidimicrobiales bacterium]|nr:hypothetical protein [Acidimicrobiales bacterium]
MLEADRAAVLDDLDAMGSGTANILTALGEGCALLGWANEVRTLYPQLQELARRHLLPLRTFDAAGTNRIAGMAAMALEQWDDAAHHLDAARHEVDTMPNEVDRPVVIHLCAELALRRPDGPGDLDPASLLTQAVAGYRTQHRALLLDQAQALAATIA